MGWRWWLDEVVGSKVAGYAYRVSVGGLPCSTGISPSTATLVVEWHGGGTATRPRHHVEEQGPVLLHTTLEVGSSTTSTLEPQTSKHTARQCEMRGASLLSSGRSVHISQSIEEVDSRRAWQAGAEVRAGITCTLASVSDEGTLGADLGSLACWCC